MCYQRYTELDFHLIKGRRMLTLNNDECLEEVEKLPRSNSMVWDCTGAGAFGRWLLCIPMAGAVLMACAVLYGCHITRGIGPITFPGMRVLSRRNAFLVDTDGCRIPALDPWDPQVLEYMEKAKPSECEAGRGRPLVASNLTSLFVVEDALADYGVLHIADIDCCYQQFYPKTYDGKTAARYAEECTRIQKEVNVEHEEFVRVRCWTNSSLIYEDYHAFVPRKAAVEERCRSQSFEDDAPSVLIVGIDSLSRLNFHRQMPRTVALLKQLGAVEMLGYNKVADNTFPNLLAAFAGHSPDELVDSLCPMKRGLYDKCHIVWDDYSNVNYRTGFAEDVGDVDLFTYDFINQPTDYYGYRFMQQFERTIGHKKQSITYQCVGLQSASEVLLQYAFKFVMTFKNDQSFGLFWESSLSHDFLNSSSLGDDMHVRFFSALEEAGVLQRSVVALMSDHGFRRGGIRQTYQGWLQDRLPTLFLLFPDWFRVQYAAAIANVELNARRLTTPFDLHETLRDLARPASQLSDEEMWRRSQELARESGTPGGPPRGISLFVEVPPDRTCDDASILPNWCTCQKSMAADRGSFIVKRAGEFIVDHINEIISSYRQCAQLIFSDVNYVKMHIPTDGIYRETRDPGVHDYMLVVRTKPGNALFEATVRHILRRHKLYIIGYVSRINQYLSQSTCVDDHALKFYCYCIGSLINH